MDLYNPEYHKGMTKTFGRYDSNDVVIKKPDISGQHARVTLIGKSGFFVEDMDSTNCTYVNGYPIKKANISFNDQVRLSKDTNLDLKTIFGLEKKEDRIKQNPKDFTEEFVLLHTVLERYEKEKLAINRNAQRKLAFLRAAITLSPLVIWILLQNLYIDNIPAEEQARWQSRYIYFSVIGSTIGMLVTGNNTSILEKQTQLQKDFQLLYVCPCCFSSLGGFSWEYWERKGICPVCEAVYSKNKL